MRVKIDADEWYPVYSLRAEDAYGAYEIEVTEEQAARWEAATRAFQSAQEELGELHRAAEAAARERAQAKKAEREAREKAEREERIRQLRAASKERQKRIEAMEGTVYDANGNPVGVVQLSNRGPTIRPLED